MFLLILWLKNIKHRIIWNIFLVNVFCKMFWAYLFTYFWGYVLTKKYICLYPCIFLKKFIKGWKTRFRWRHDKILSWLKYLPFGQERKCFLFLRCMKFVSIFFHEQWVPQHFLSKWILLWIQKIRNLCKIVTVFCIWHEAIF